MSKTKSYRFHSLTPRMLDKNRPSYKISKKALDESYSNIDIKNIAITGIYGSGKSSFLKTYFSGKTNKNTIINVSIADFENSTSDPKKIKIAERQIINQILYHIPSRKIPLSKFRLKDKRRWWNILLSTFVLTLFTIGLFSIFNQTLLDFMYSNLLKVTNVSYYSNLTILVSLLIPVVLGSTWLSRRIFFKLSKVNFKGTESEVTEEDDSQLLDQEVREIVYLILASNIETIIFEDLDRFEDISIFIRLREINSLVNSRSKKTVRFIYVIKDDLFESKDRTKFFDLMIPIIPEVTSHNSRGKVLEIFSDIEEDHLKISPKVLEKISVFIDDMRLLYSIRNEYEIYSKGLETDVYSDELFALLVLKNIFPKEFEELENDKGYLYKILNKREELIKEYEEYLSEKIKEREELRNLLVIRLSDFLAMNIPPTGISLNTSQSHGEFMFNWYKNKDSKQYIYINGYGYHHTFQTFIEMLCKKDTRLKERLEQINYNNLDIKLESLDEEILKLNNDISKRRTTKTSQLLSELDEEKLSFYFEEDNEGFKEIINNHYFPLIRFLMLSGLVDENYWRYKGYFHEGYLGPNDNIFINRVLSGKTIKNDFKLDKPSSVINYFENVDYQRKDIVNYDLIDELIKQQRGIPLLYILRTIKSNSDLEAINYINLLDYVKLKKMVNLLLDLGSETFFEIFSIAILPNDLRIKLTGLAFENQTFVSNSEINDFISKNSEILELDYFKDIETIMQTLERLNIKFKTIKNLVVEDYIYQFIADKSLYFMNLDNLIKLTNELLLEHSDSEKYTLQNLFKFLFSSKNKSIEEYARENLEEIIIQYLDRIEDQNLKSSSGTEVFIDLLNSNLSEDSKIRLIEVESSIVNNLNDVNSSGFWVDLFKYDLVKSTENNMLTYYEETGEVSSIIEFLNKNYKVEFELSQDMYKEILNNVKTDINLFDLVKEEITESLHEINPDIGIEKIRLLTSNNLIELNSKNMLHVINTNDNSLLIQFIKAAKNTNASVNVVSILIKPNILECLSISNVEDILNEKLFYDNDNVKFLQAYNKKISLFSINEANKVTRKFIFNNLFSINDIELIIDDYINFDLWDDFIIILNTSTKIIDEVTTKNMPEGFIDKILNDENLKEILKVKILESIILGEKYYNKWKTWISSIETLKTIANVFDNAKPVIENQNQLIIAEALKSVGVISIGNDKRLHFKPKKFEGLIY